jgi:DMSO/TMAO reductase YedYZ molybdopterin-dependent catalytic subunit
MTEVSPASIGGTSIKWRSPIRGPWLTSVFGLILLIGIPIEFVTGLLSYAAYDPKLRGNDPNPRHGLLGVYVFDWFTAPSWVFRLIEGTHVVLGLALVPIVLAKLWSVMPQLFAWPPFRSVAHALERLTLVMLVGGVIFEMTTGIADIDYLGVPSFNFYTGHFYGAWIFVAAFVAHVVLRFGRMRSAFKARPIRQELKVDLARTVPDPTTTGATAPTISRRGVLAMVGGSSLLLVVLTAGDTVGGVLRPLALLGTRDGSPGSGPNGFPVNHTAASVGVGPEQVAASWRLELSGAHKLEVSRADLLAMPLIHATMPIACTEGWSTTQRWTGVRLAELAALAGVAQPGRATVETLDGQSVELSAAQVNAGTAMLALAVNGADLSLDHGYPARIMVPAAPGTHNKKWVRGILFEGA